MMAKINELLANMENLKDEMNSNMRKDVKIKTITRVEGNGNADVEANAAAAALI